MATPTGGTWRAVKAVSEHEEMNPACRMTMEDAHIAVDALGGDESQALFGVFDGHGGRGVVDFVARNFERNLLSELAFEDGRRSVQECLTSAYLITDIQTSKHGLSVSGSTAVTCLLRKEGPTRVLYTANVGDSRAVLCRRGRGLRLSFDHKASEDSEVKRIEDAGGFILRKRVLGILAVSRSFGDHAMKKFVVARPHVERTELERDNDRFLIIACDGVWDVIGDQEAVDIVQKALDEEHVAPEALAQYLVTEALARSSSDNITALVVLL